MTVHELEVTRPATTVQEVKLAPINAAANPGRVWDLSVVKSGNQTVNLAPVNAAGGG